MNALSPGVAVEPASPARPAEPDHRQFVDWLRQVAPYIHAFRGKTIVVGFPGELVQAGQLNALIQDIALLQALGMRMIVCHGARPQINEQIRLRGAEVNYSQGMRVADGVALECAKEASGELRLDIEAAFSQGLPNTPMAHAAVRVISGNLITARPIGIIDGVDFGHTGLVRKVDVRTMNFALNGGSIVLLSPLGFSPTGEAFSLAMEDVAAATAAALDADKLIFVTETPGVVDLTGKILGEISENEAKRLLGQDLLPPDSAFYLKHALRACEGGVSRAHIIPFSIDGSVLLELFKHDGVGTMLVEETLEELREATLEDVGGIISLIRPLEDDGTLVKRDRAKIEHEITNFTVIEHDKIIFGCAALYPFPTEQIGEMACLAVNPSAQGQGDGDRILKRIEQRARAMGLKRLFVLTTRTTHWFLKRGFVLAGLEALPAERKRLYNWQRKSQILIKNL
ncbi:MAG: amino-acid N-acetyltransferase [Burkholderiaceae bacterium]